MSVIFLSHSSDDNALAAEVRAWLEQEGHRSVFLDFDPAQGIPAGRNWKQELYQQLRSCRAVVVLCSRSSMASKWCFAEITQARALGKALLPIRIDDCAIDSVLHFEQAVDLRRGRAESYERLRRGLLAAGVDPAAMFDWDGSRPPYPGLMALQEADAAVFFGRSEEVARGVELLNRVRRLGGPGLMVVGPSGSGKSSLVRAGIVPQLRRDVERWLVIDPFRPRLDPVAELAAVWAKALDEAGTRVDPATVRDRVRAALAGAQNPLVEMADDLRRASGRSDPKVLVVIDQFEELLGPDVPEAAGVLRLIRTAAEARGGPLVMVGTLRSDFLGAYQQHPELTRLDCEQLSVGPMTIEGITEVIEGPARIAGLTLGPGLVPAMLADMGSDDALPLLAFTLRELYDRFGADDRVLEAKEYRELGGLLGALARVADELVQSQHLDPDREGRDLRRALLAMVRLTEDDRWVRQVVPRADLPASIQPIIDQFIDPARLLVAAGDPEARTVEVAHEALFRSWRQLARWLDENAEALRLKRDLRNAAGAWHDAGEHDSDLWRGARLERADELAQDGDLTLDALSQAFLDASLAARRAEFDARERARRRNLRIAAAVTSGALVLTAVASVSFVLARRSSDRAAASAAVARRAQVSAVDALQQLARVVVGFDTERQMQTRGQAVGTPLTQVPVGEPDDSCREAGTARSTTRDAGAGDAVATLVVTNETGSELTVHWLSPAGEEIRWGSIEPEGSLLLDVVAGWRFLVTDHTGACRRVI